MIHDAALTATQRTPAPDKRAARWPRHWLIAAGVAALVHLSVGTGVVRIGYGGSGDDEAPPMEVELPPDMPPPAPEPIPAAAPASTQVSATPVASPMLTPRVVAPMIDRPVAKDTPSAAPEPTTATQSNTQAAQSSTSAQATQSSSQPTGTTASAGDGKSGEPAPDAAQQQKLEADYKSLVQQHIARHRFAPKGAKKAGVSGTVTLQFHVDRSGGIKNVTVAGGSGHAILDQEAVAHLRAISPVPKYPRDLRKAEVFLKIRLKYDLQTQ